MPSPGFGTQVRWLPVPLSLFHDLPTSNIILHYEHEVTSSTSTDITYHSWDHAMIQCSHAYTMRFMGGDLAIPIFFMSAPVLDYQYLESAFHYVISIRTYNFCNQWLGSESRTLLNLEYRVNFLKFKKRSRVVTYSTVTTYQHVGLQLMHAEPS